MNDISTDELIDDLIKWISDQPNMIVTYSEAYSFLNDRGCNVPVLLLFETVYARKLFYHSTNIMGYFSVPPKVPTVANKVIDLQELNLYIVSVEDESGRTHKTVASASIREVALAFPSARAIECRGTVLVARED